MESSTEQMGEDPKYGGDADEEKSESEGKPRKEGEDDEEVDLQEEANAESSGDSEEKESAVDKSDSEGKQEEIEAEEDAGDDEASDNETLVSIYLPTLSPKTYDREMSRVLICVWVEWDVQGAWKSKVAKSSSKKSA